MNLLSTWFKKAKLSKLFTWFCKANLKVNAMSDAIWDLQEKQLQLQMKSSETTHLITSTLKKLSQERWHAIRKVWIETGKMQILTEHSHSVITMKPYESQSVLKCRRILTCKACKQKDVLSLKMYIW